jgi:hypothetical protein
MHFYKTVFVALFMVASAKVVGSECARHLSELVQHMVPAFPEDYDLSLAVAYVKGDFEVDMNGTLVHPHYDTMVIRDKIMCRYHHLPEAIGKMKNNAEDYLKITDPKKQRIYKAVKFFIQDRDLDCRTPEEIERLVKDLGDSTDKDDPLKPIIEHYKNIAMWMKDGTIIKSNARMWLKSSEQEYLTSIFDKMRKNRKGYRGALKKNNVAWFIAWSGTYKLALYPAEQIVRDTNPANEGF